MEIILENKNYFGVGTANLISVIFNSCSLKYLYASLY